MQKYRLLHVKACRRIIADEMTHLTFAEVKKAHIIASEAKHAIENQMFACILNAKGQPPVFIEFKAWVKSNYPWLDDANLENAINRCIKHF